MIRLQAVGKRFGERWVLRGVELEVARGESVVIIGPSGGGKSVLLKLACGLLTPDEGRALCESANVGMLFQRNALFDSLTVLENLLFPLRERKGLEGPLARARAEAMLDAVGLLNSANLYPDEISGGMQKRLGIARTLIVEPEVVLYDEPTAGLDPITSRMIADMIVGLRDLPRSRHLDSGSPRMTLLTVTNDMPRAYQLGDRIFLLSNGKLREGGSPDAVRTTLDPELREFVTGRSPAGDARSSPGNGRAP